MIEFSTHGHSKTVEPLAIDLLLKLFGTELFLTKTVEELISGYQDPLMAMAKTFLPAVVKDDKFSLLNGVFQHAHSHFSRTFLLRGFYF
jgi:hypothetical protein